MFGTSGIRGRVGEDITADLALAVGRALATNGADSVVVGRDVRESGEVLQAALAAGLRECGCEIIRLGRVTTPTVARAVTTCDADAGVAITASHNPPEDNGFKLWASTGQAFNAAQRAEIAELIESDTYDLQPWDGHEKDATWEEAEAHHRRTLVSAGRDLSGFSIAVDIGNGVGGITVDALYKLGADVTTINAREDGRFPGRSSEPTAETCTDLCTHVGCGEIDLGIAHDGDADRMLAVTEEGDFLAGDILLALFARQQATAGDRIAAPVNTSLAVDDALAPLGATVTRTPVGDTYVAECTTEADMVFGGEPSGAWIWPEAIPCPDGPLAAVKLASLVAAEGPLSSLAADIDDYPLRRDSIEVDPDTKTRIMSAVLDRGTEQYETVSTMDGLRVEHDEGWFLVRASGTQPLIRLTAQARSQERTEELFATARALVEDYV